MPFPVSHTLHIPCLMPFPVFTHFTHTTSHDLPCFTHFFTLTLTVPHAFFSKEDVIRLCLFLKEDVIRLCLFVNQSFERCTHCYWLLQPGQSSVLTFPHTQHTVAIISTLCSVFCSFSFFEIFLRFWKNEARLFYFQVSITKKATLTVFIEPDLHFMWF